MPIDHRFQTLPYVPGVPDLPGEFIPMGEAIRRSGRARPTFYKIIARAPITRVDFGLRLCSLPGMLMVQAGDRVALDAYVAGDRTSPIVANYLRRAGVPVPASADAGH